MLSYFRKYKYSNKYIVRRQTGHDKGVTVRMFSILFGSLSANNNPAPANHL
jgi:hypothetical protein